MLNRDGCQNSNRGRTLAGRDNEAQTLVCRGSTARQWHLRFVAAAIGWTVVAALPAQAAGPVAVDLRTAGDFVILLKAGISTTGVTAVTGDIGVSPITATAVTGFGLILTPPGKFATSALVTGKVYAAGDTSPTPARMNAAIGDMETAYADAAGRTSPDFTELYSGDLTGETLVPGLYKWGTGVLISAGGVTLAGSPTSDWIFQIAQDLTVDASAIVHLTGGASAGNVFWQVAGRTTIGTTAQRKGVVL